MCFESTIRMGCSLPAWQGGNKRRTRMSARSVCLLTGDRGLCNTIELLRSPAVVSLHRRPIPSVDWTVPFSFTHRGGYYMAKLRVVSADSHMMEPADLWETRLDKKFRERAPKVVKNSDKPGLVFVAEGIRPFPVAGGFGAGRSGEELKDHLTKGYEAARPSGWDPVERVKDQDIDGVEAEVLYTTLGMPLFGLEDGNLQRACFASYNDWVAEFCAQNPKRLYGISLISLEDIDEGVKELERTHKNGMRGAMIWGSPPADKPYSSRIYDKLWQAASELHMPLSLHVITGKGKESQISFDEISTGYMNLIHEVQRS